MAVESKIKLMRNLCSSFCLQWLIFIVQLLLNSIGVYFLRVCRVCSKVDVSVMSVCIIFRHKVILSTFHMFDRRKFNKRCVHI